MQFCNYSEPICERTVEWIPSFILPTSFCWHNQYHNAFIGMEGGGWWDILTIRTEDIQMTPIGTIFSSTYRTKQLTPWPISSTSHVEIYIWMSGCPRKMEPCKDHPNTHECLKNLRKKQQQK